MKKGRPTTSDRLTELCKDESFGGNSDDDGEKPKDSNEVKDMIADLDAKWKQLDDMMNQCTRNMVRNFAPVFRRLANPKDGPPDPAKMNGRLAPASWPPPKLAVECSKLNRGELGGKITASEYLDSDEVLDKKMDLIAKLIRKSKHTCAYCGAGLSRGAGISDYATKAEGSVASSSTKDLGHPTEALPTAGHHILTALQKAGFIHSFVQQNHDGLPQKAGFPQRLINEIHGGWYDPSNTVVPMSGQLRKDLADWMVDVEEKTELTLCLGTSLSGMTSDRLATTPAMRSEEKDENGKPCSSCIGTVIINLQQTSEDDEACVRVWSRIDDAMILLANKLGLEYNANPVAWPKDTDVFQVPYNSAGQRDLSTKTTVDLSYGSRVIVSHPKAANLGSTGLVIGRDKLGHWLIAFKRKHLKGSVQRRLGAWWMQDALAGIPEYLPVVNTPGWNSNGSKKGKQGTEDCQKATKGAQ